MSAISRACAAVTARTAIAETAAATNTVRLGIRGSLRGVDPSVRGPAGVGLRLVRRRCRGRAHDDLDVQLLEARFDRFAPHELQEQLATAAAALEERLANR